MVWQHLPSQVHNMLRYLKQTYKWFWVLNSFSFQSLDGICKVLHLGGIAPCPSVCQQLTRWRSALQGRDKDLHNSSNMRQECVLVPRRANSLLTASRRREAILPLCLALECCVQVCFHSVRDRQERVPKETTKMIGIARSFQWGLVSLREGMNLGNVWIPDETVLEIKARLFSVVLRGTGAQTET